MATILLACFAIFHVIVNLFGADIPRPVEQVDFYLAAALMALLIEGK